MCPIIIEELQKKDLKEAISIYDINFNSKTNYDKLLQEYDDIYKSSEIHNIVAKLNGKVVGLATFFLHRDIVEELHPFLTVWNFCVHKDYRRMKIGSIMLDYIYDYAKSLNCDFISLIAEKDNVAAQRFYENLGYEKEVGYFKLIEKR